jgi:hypothetical protein
MVAVGLPVAEGGAGAIVAVRLAGEVGVVAVVGGGLLQLTINRPARRMERETSRNLPPCSRPQRSSETSEV